jgi:hypothetical protein
MGEGSSSSRAGPRGAIVSFNTCGRWPALGVLGRGRPALLTLACCATYLAARPSTGRTGPGRRSSRPSRRRGRAGSPPKSPPSKPPSAAPQTAQPTPTPEPTRQLADRAACGRAAGRTCQLRHVLGTCHRKGSRGQCSPPPLLEAAPWTDRPDVSCLSRAMKEPPRRHDGLLTGAGTGSTRAGALRRASGLRCLCVRACGLRASRLRI